jgi:hypothetical protein
MLFFCKIYNLLQKSEKPMKYCTILRKIKILMSAMSVAARHNAFIRNSSWAVDVMNALVTRFTCLKWTQILSLICIGSYVPFD